MPVLDLSRAISACGTSGFSNALLEDIASFLQVKSCGAVEYSRLTSPHYIALKDIDPESAQLYIEATYRLDPFYRLWLSSGNKGVINLNELRLKGGHEAEKTEGYILRLQPGLGMKDELSLLLGKIGGAVDNYFFLSENLFSDKEISALSAAESMLQALYELHEKILLSQACLGAEETAVIPTRADSFAVYDRHHQQVYCSDSWPELVTQESGLVKTVSEMLTGVTESATFGGFSVVLDQLSEYFSPCPKGKIVLISTQPKAILSPVSASILEDLFADKLTEREITICLLILKGYSSNDIAETLQITLGTVKNHRKSIYRKLEITSERELFVMLIEYASSEV